MSEDNDFLHQQFRGENFRVENDFSESNLSSHSIGNNDDMSPNRKKSKNRFYLHDDRKGGVGQSYGEKNSPQQSQYGTKTTSVISSLPSPPQQSDWKHDKFDEVTRTQKSSSPHPPKDNSPKSNLLNFLSGEKHLNSSSPSASAADSTKVSGDQVRLTTDSSNASQKNSRKKKNNSNPQAVDQTAAQDSPPDTYSLNQTVNSGEDHSDKKHQEKGKNKQKQKNKQEGADKKFDHQEKSTSKGSSKLEIIPPPAAPTPPMGSTPAAVPVPFGNVGSGTVDVAAGTGKSNNRRNKKGKNSNQAAANDEPEEKSLLSSKSHVVVIQNEPSLNAPPPPPPSPSISAASNVFDCDDFLITALTENMTSTLSFGDVPKKRKRNKKKKNTDKAAEEINCQSDDEVGELPIHRHNDSDCVLISAPDDLVEDVDVGQQSSKSSKKKKKNKKKADEPDTNESVSLPAHQTEPEKNQSQKNRQHPDKGPKSQPVVVPEEVKSDKGSKQKNSKSEFVEPPPVESKMPNGLRTSKGYSNQPSVSEQSQSAIRAGTASKSDPVEDPPIEREGKKKRRSRRKKKNQGSNGKEDSADVDEDEGPLYDDAPYGVDDHASQVTYDPTPDPTTVLSYSIFEATRKSSNLDDFDVPPGFEPPVEDKVQYQPSIEDTFSFEPAFDEKISSFLPSSLSALPKSGTILSRDLDAIDLANKSIDDLVAESLSSLSRLNLDSTIDDLDTSIDIERELRQSFPFDTFFRRGGSPSIRPHSPPMSIPSSVTIPSSEFSKPTGVPPPPRFPLEIQSRLKPTARPFEPKKPPYAEGRSDFPGTYLRDQRDSIEFIPSKYGPKSLDYGAPVPSSRPNPGQLRYAYDEPEHFGGMSPEDVIISRLPGRRPDRMVPRGMTPPPPMPRPRPPSSSYALDRDGYYDRDEYMPPYPPSSSSAYVNPRPFPPPGRPPPPRMDIGGRSGTRYPPNAPMYPGVEKYTPSGPPRDRDSGPVPGINFTLASQQPRTHIPHQPPPPPPHQHW